MPTSKRKKHGKVVQWWQIVTCLFPSTVELCIIRGWRGWEEQKVMLGGFHYSAKKNYSESMKRSLGLPGKAGGLDPRLMHHRSLFQQMWDVPIWWLMKVDGRNLGIIRRAFKHTFGINVFEPSPDLKNNCKFSSWEIMDLVLDDAKSVFTLKINHIFNSFRCEKWFNFLYFFRFCFLFKKMNT